MRLRPLVPFFGLLCVNVCANAAAPSIGAGELHSVAVHADGTVRAWGDDTNGQLGIGRGTFSARPVTVLGLANATSVAAGGSFSLARGSDGRVWAWGANDRGQLGDGTFADRSVPVSVTGLSQVTAVTAAIDFSVALRSDGTVWTWGDGSHTPVQVSGLAGITAISAGFYHALALRSDGTVWAWGRNDSGQLGDGTTIARSTPVQILGASGAIAICADDERSLVVSSDGAVSWVGSDRASRVSSLTRIPIPAAVSVTAWGGYVFVRTANSEVWIWVAFTQTASRVDVRPARAVHARNGNLLVVAEDGSVWTWGRDELGNLGDGEASQGSGMPPTPAARVIEVNNATGGIVGMDHMLAVLADGTVRAWGGNRRGELGNETITKRSTPHRVAGLTGVTKIASSATGFHTLALKEDGTVWGWGRNERRQLGDGTVFERSTPIRIGDLADVVAIAAGQAHSVVATRDGSVWSWGDDDVAGFHAVPRRVEGVSDVVDVSAGNYFSVALKRDGTVWAWGSNNFGQLGDGTTTARGTPAPVAGLARVILISSGSGHTLAVKDDGSVWSWGANSSGQLGDGTHLRPDNSYTHALMPVRVLGLNSPSKVSAGATFSSAVTGDGKVWLWGTSQDGLSGTDPTVLAPKVVEGLGNVDSIAAGGRHVVALKRDATVLPAGGNRHGQVGDGTLVSRSKAAVSVREEGAGRIESNDWYLDLDPRIPKHIDPDKVPPFGLVATGMVTEFFSDVRATIQFRAQDVGAQRSIFVFAMAPESQVRGASVPGVVKLGYAKDQRKAETPIGCVLAQLNAAGQMVAVTSANLAAYLTGVLSAQGASVSILNGVPTGNVSGATFFVGYGSSAGSMISGGVNRAAVTIPGSLTCEPAAPQTGWWWNPSEDGRGYSIEKRGNNLFFAAFLYHASGRSTWHVSSGPASLEGTLYNGDLLAASGGQTLGGAYPGFPTLRTEGPMTLTFNNALTGTLVWPGGTVPIQRFNIIPNGLALPPVAGQPESGWWWNEQEPGRGFFLEFQGGTLDIAGYMYDAEGNPVWYLTVGNIGGTPGARSFSGTWWSYGNGMTLAGPWRPHTRTNANVAPLTITFTGADTALMTLPNERTTTLKRHRF